MEADVAHMRMTIWLMIITLFIVVVFAIFPFIDLHVAALFFKKQPGAWIGDEQFYRISRDALRRGTEVFACMTLIIFLSNLKLAYLQRTGWRVWAFIGGSMLLCGGILVNGVLKAHLGRARPNGVLEFGGSQLFTPPFQISDQCVTNCSFSSGEVAMVASIVLPVCVLLWPHLSRTRKYLCSMIGIFLVVAVCLLRMAAGRHFLSDVIMSTLFAALITLFLYRALDMRRHRALFTPSAIRHDWGHILKGGLVVASMVARYSISLAISVRMLVLGLYGRITAEGSRS